MSTTSTKTIKPYGVDFNVSHLTGFILHEEVILSKGKKPIGQIIENVKKRVQKIRKEPLRWAGNVIQHHTKQDHIKPIKEGRNTFYVITEVGKVYIKDHYGMTQRKVTMKHGPKRPKKKTV